MSQGCILLPFDAGSTLARSRRCESAWKRVFPSEIERLKGSTDERLLVLSDSGSGLSTTRKRLSQLLKMVCEDRVGEVVVTYGDRLTRFGQEYLETLFDSFGVTLTILSPDAEKTAEQELTDDLLPFFLNTQRSLSVSSRGHQLRISY